MFYKMFLIVAAFLASQAVMAADNNSYEIAIKNHRFEPAEVTVPAGQKIRLLVKNQDPTPEEFESYELNREKVIPGGSQAVIFIGPLKPGKYPFFGEFHAATAKGVIVAK